MLGPEYLAQLPNALCSLWRQVEDDILRDIARRITAADGMTETAVWQAQRMELLRTVQNDTVNTLAKYAKRSRSEIRRLLTEAGTATLAADDAVHRAAGKDPVPGNESPALLDLLNAGYRQTLGSWQNLTATTAATVTGELEQRLDRAWLQVSTGAIDYNTAIRRAVDDLADGMKYVTYPTGHRDTLETAVRRCVLTGVNQAAAKLQLARMEELGCEFVEVTAHEGARPSHAVWQGKIYHIGGAVTLDGVRYEDFAKATGYGTGAGLCGWNCRHNFYPYWPGISVPNYTETRLAALNAKCVTYGGKQYTRYEISQMRRDLERRVRKYQRRFLAEDAAGVDTGPTAVKLKAARKALTAFVQDTDGKQDEGRTRLQSARNNAILKETSGSYKEITMQSIQNVQPFACETLDAAGSRALANAHKKLLLEARKVPLGVEKARCYGLDMQPLGGYYESDAPGKSVKIKVPGVDCIVMHTHPSGLTFSPQDLAVFANHTSIKLLTAVGNDGALYAVERTTATNEGALRDLTKRMLIDVSYAKTKVAVYDALNAYFAGVEKYGIHYYAAGD